MFACPGAAPVAATMATGQSMAPD